MEQVSEAAARFELLEQLGKGSYGSVFKGRARDTGDLFAIKVIALVEGVRCTPSKAAARHFAPVSLSCTVASKLYAV